MRNTNDGVVAESPGGSAAEPSEDPLLRFAMLSVYYASLGRQFEIRGAPSVLLPPQVRPLDLATALDLLRVSPVRLREALWLIVRGVRSQGLPSEHRESYPSEFEMCFLPGSLEDFRLLRREYRAGANVFAAALVAVRDGFADQFEELRKVWDAETSRHPRGFSAVTSLMSGMPGSDYLARGLPGDDQRPTTRSQIERLEFDVGLNVH